MTQKWLDDIPTRSRIVMYHHGGDGKDYPAIVVDVRGRDKAGFYVPDDKDDEFVNHVVDATGGPVTVQLHLTVFRPGAIEWRWCARNDDPTDESYWGGWSWPTRAP